MTKIEMSLKKKEKNNKNKKKQIAKTRFVYFINNMLAISREILRKKKS